MSNFFSLARAASSSRFCSRRLSSGTYSSGSEKRDFRATLSRLVVMTLGLSRGNHALYRDFELGGRKGSAGAGEGTAACCGSSGGGRREHAYAADDVGRLGDEIEAHGAEQDVRRAKDDADPLRDALGLLHHRRPGEGRPGDDGQAAGPAAKVEPKVRGPLVEHRGRLLAREALYKGISARRNLRGGGSFGFRGLRLRRFVGEFVCGLRGAEA